MADRITGWKLVRFTEEFNRWVALDSPGQDLCAAVAQWIPTRRIDPYHGKVKREQEHGHHNLWACEIPSTYRPDWTVVLCSYFVMERVQIVRCDSIRTLSWPTG